MSILKQNMPGLNDKGPGGSALEKLSAQLTAQPNMKKEGTIIPGLTNAGKNEAISIIDRAEIITSPKTSQTVKSNFNSLSGPRRRGGTVAPSRQDNEIEPRVIKAINRIPIF